MDHRIPLKTLFYLSRANFHHHALNALNLLFRTGDLHKVRLYYHIRNIVALRCLPLGLDIHTECLAGIIFERQHHNLRLPRFDCNINVFLIIRAVIPHGYLDGYRVDQ